MKFAINKSWIFAFAVAALGSTNAHAIFNPNWERPVLIAAMEIHSATGLFSQSKEVSVTMNRRDGQGEYTTVTVMVDDQATVLNVVSVKKDACGSKIIVATKDAPPQSADFPVKNLTLADHATRVCEDYRPHRWEAKLVMSGGFAGMRSELVMSGNPQHAITIARAQVE